MIILRKHVTLEQREYGKITKFLPKSIAKHIDTNTRAVKYEVGRIRRNIATKLENQISSDLEAMRKKPRTIGPKNKEVDQKLVEEAGKYDTKVVNSSDKYGARAITDTKGPYAEIELSPESESSKAVKVAIKNKNNKAVIVPDEHGTSSSKAHELNHVINRRGKNPLRKFINLFDKPGVRESVDVNNPQSFSKKRNIGSVLMQPIKSRLIKQEERNSTSGAIKTLEKAGMPKEELDLAKKSLEESGETYKNAAKIRQKGNIRSIVQIPSRKSLSPSNTVPTSFAKDEEGSIKKIHNKIWGDNKKIKRYDKNKYKRKKN